VFFGFAAANMIGGLGFGYVVDRVRRRPFMIVVNLVTGLLVLALFFVHDRGDAWILYATAIMYGLSTSALGSARSGFLKDLLPDESLAYANAALRTVVDGLRLISPLIGAGLFAAVGGGAVAAFDAATFVVAAALLWTIKLDESPIEPSDAPFRKEVLAGVAHIRRTPALRKLVLTVTAALLVVGFLETLFVAVVDAGLHRAPSFLGVLEAFGGAGGILGGVTAVFVVRKFGEVRAVGVGMATVAVGCALLAASSVPIVLAGTFLMWIGIPWVVVPFITLQQRLTPPRLQGRVGAATEFSLGTTQTVSIAVGAALSTTLDHRLLLAVVAAWLVTCAISLLASRVPVVPAAAPDFGDAVPVV
jgi:MFS family permease